MPRLAALCSCFLGLAIAIGGSAAFAAPALARDYAAVNAIANSVEYLDPATVKTGGDIKTFWAYTVYISTNNLGIDWTSEYESIDCKNDRMITLGVVGYRMNGDVVGNTENDPNIHPRWIDIPPETGAAAEEDAVCHGNVLGTDSGTSFSEVVPVARRRLIQIATQHPQTTRALQQNPSVNGNTSYGILPQSMQHGALSRVLGALGDAYLIHHDMAPAHLQDQQSSTPPPVGSANGTGAGQPVYSASECVGPIVAGVCHGAILPNQATHPVCHGEMLNGVCTGPMF